MEEKQHGCSKADFVALVGTRRGRRWVGGRTSSNATRGGESREECECIAARREGEGFAWRTQTTASFLLWRGETVLEGVGGMCFEARSATTCVLRTKDETASRNNKTTPTQDEQDEQQQDQKDQRQKRQKRKKKKKRKKEKKSLVLALACARSSGAKVFVATTSFLFAGLTDAVDDDDDGESGDSTVAGEPYGTAPGRHPESSYSFLSALTGYTNRRRTPRKM